MKHLESFVDYLLEKKQPYRVSFGSYEDAQDLFNNGGALNPPGDPYQYKIIGDKWYARRNQQGLSAKELDEKGVKWINITIPKYQKSIHILDDTYPNARRPGSPLMSGVKKNELTPPTQKELLEKIRLSIKKSIDEMPLSAEKPHWDKILREGPFNQMNGIGYYTGAKYFWPILPDDHPSKTYENFSKLFINFWSKGTCPKNWKSEFDKWISSGLKNGDQSEKNWYENFKKFIPNIETYGKVESEWLNLYAQSGGFIPKGKNLYEYYKTLKP